MSDFDLKAKSWDTPDKIERAGAVADAIRSGVSLSKEMTGFEYGCGTGLLSFELQHDIGAITMADSSNGMLEVLNEKLSRGSYPDMNPVKLDLMTDPIPNQRYDIVYTMLTLHHIPDISAILHHFHTILKKGGYLCVADLDKEDGSFHGSTAHSHNGFDRKKLGDLVEKAGFGNISFTTAYNLTKEVQQGEKTFPVFLMVAQKH